ncbi:hypothetical protein H0H92_012178 [Tricholoma furcatifolium]|nr:hypothetical protein H0H92_012178 [Tricholoma furcatifolium]
MSPPRAPLSWNEIVEYAFLADFDLLRDTRQDVKERAWARPSARLAMDQYFKIERAREEIYRLNIEIRRVVTHMRDEEAFLLAKERDITRTHTALAYQVRLYREERTRFYGLHRRRFKKLAANSRFTGSITPGAPINKSLLLPDDMDIDDESVLPSSMQEEKENTDNEEEEEEEVLRAQEDEEDAGGVGRLAEALDAFSIAI